MSEHKTRFCYQDSVRSGKPVPCTQEMLETAMKSEKVKKICAEIAALDPEADDYEEKKGALKKQLPIITPLSCAFKNDRRVSTDAVPSGLVMLDVDHVEDPQAVFEKQVKPVTEKEGIYFAAITPSGQGLRIIAERKKGESIEDGMERVRKACGFEEIDGVVKDLARASFLMPWEYLQHYEPEHLFEWPDEETERYWKTEGPSPALPQRERVETAGETEGNGATRCAAQGESAGETAGDGATIRPEAYDNDTQHALRASCYDDKGEELCYMGIPYKDITDALLTVIGQDGGAVKGERNNTYFSMANYMRYICDFDADLLLRVLPDFGLGEQERKTTIRSALGRPRKNEMPQTMVTAVELARLRQKEEAVEKGKQKASDLPLPKLPRLLRIICKRLPESYWPAIIIAVQPILGALATDTHFRYLDGQKHTLSFFSIITAMAASGKSFIRKPIDLLLTPINEQDKIELEKMREYDEQVRASKNSETQPEDPHACPRNNGVNISVTRLLQLMNYSGGKHLIGISEELDSLLKSEKAGVWSQKSDIYRCAFDNSEYGQAYMSQNSWSGKEAIYYNMLLTGTPSAVMRFFSDDNLENGLMTRTCFAKLPDMAFAQMPKFEDYTEKEKEEIIRIARQLDKEEGLIRCTAVEKAIEKWIEEKRQQAIDADSRAADMLRRRSGVIGYRAGMVCYLLEGRKNKAMVGEFAVWVAEYVFRTQMELFGDKLEKIITSGQEMMTGHGEATSLLNQLPQEFTKQELISLRLLNKQSAKRSAITTLLSRWKESNRIEKIGEGRYRKCA